MISMIGTLPPLKGDEYYDLYLSSSIARHEIVQFVNFEKLYPSFLYPGGDKDSGFVLRIPDNVFIETFIKWYNPFSWVKAAFRVKGRVVHLQWWSLATFFIYFT